MMSWSLSHIVGDDGHSAEKQSILTRLLDSVKQVDLSLNKRILTK